MPISPSDREPTIPPAVIGILLLITVVLAVSFILAAELVHTP